MPRPITSLAHAALDYPAGLLVLASPWLCGYADVGDGAPTVAVVVGLLLLLQSAITDYELSVADVLPMAAHLAIDVVAGVVLAVSPFVLGVADDGTNAWLPQVVLGLGLIGSGLLTRPYRETERAAPSSVTRS